METKVASPVEGESIIMAPLGDSKREKKVIFMKQHSRTSSESSCSGDEQQADPILPTKVVEATEDAPSSRRISGRCLCKLSIVLYLLGCVLISTLYVIFYGNKQQIFGEEAWIPGKVGVVAKKFCPPSVNSIFATLIHYIPPPDKVLLDLFTNIESDKAHSEGCFRNVRGVVLLGHCLK